MHPCGNPRSSPAAAPQQPRSSPAAALALQPLHCSPQRGSRWGRRGNVWWRPSLTIPWRAPRQSRARPHLHLPRARLRRSYDILRTPHGGLCNLHCPQHRTPTPHLHPSPAPLDLTPASTVTRPAAPHTPPGPLAYGAGDGRGTAEEPYMLCVVLITCMTRPRSISAEIATSRAELGSASTPVSSPQTAAFPTIQPLP